MSMEKRYPKTILATACVPWDEQYRFAEAPFRKQVRELVARGIAHLYLFGTAGEGYAVTETQYGQIVAAFAEEMSGEGLFPMVGLVSLSFATMRERLETAYAHGIRDFQFALPSWGALSDRELELFFHSLCDPYPDCRFMHYNLGRSKRIVTAAEYFRFAAEIPNFVGAKYMTNDALVIHSLVAKNSPLQFYFDETGYLIGSLFGECGLLVSTVNTHLVRARELFASGGRDAAAIARYFDECAGVLDGLFACTGEEKIDGAYDKLIYRAIDPEFPLRMLPPYSTTTEEQCENYRKFLREHYPQWIEA